MSTKHVPGAPRLETRVWIVVFLFMLACSRSDPVESQKFEMLMNDPLLQLSVAGLSPQGAAMGNAGGHANEPGATPANALRKWSVDGDPVAIFSAVFKDAARAGVTFTTLSCSGINKPNLIAGGWKRSGRWIASVSLALQGDTFTLFLSEAPGNTPGPLPPQTRLIYDGSCPNDVERVAGV